MQERSEPEIEKTETIFSQSIMSGLLLSLIMFSVVFFGADTLARMLGATGKYAPEATAYLNWKKNSIKGLGIIS